MPKLRFPLVASINTRFGADDLLPGQSGIVGESIVGVAVVGQSPSGSSKDARMINCFPIYTSNPFTQNNASYLVKRPGWAVYTTPQAGSVGSAILVWSGYGAGDKVISAFGGTNSSIYDGSTQLVTDNATTTVITGKATGITETTLSGTATLLISSSDSTAWWYQNGGTVTKVTDSNYPGNAGKTIAGTFAHLDGFAFVMTTDGYIYHSDINSVSSWNALSVISAGAYPDKGIACVRFKQFIVGFGPQTMEFFANAGNSTGSVLSRQQSMTAKIGLCNSEAYASFSDTLYWVGSSSEGGISVYRLSDSIKKISTPVIDAKLALAGPSNISVNVASFYGTSHILVRAKTATFVYCAESDCWYEWSGSAVLWDKSASLSVGSAINVYALSKTSTAGKVYVMNPASRTFQDAGIAYNATFITPTLDADTGNRKFWSSMTVAADTETSSSNLTVSWSDDDYAAFNTSEARTISLTSSNKRIRKLGNSRNRVFRFDHSDNTPMRIRAVEVEYEVGAV